MSATRIAYYAKLDGFESPGQVARYLTNTEQVVMVNITLLNAAPLVVDHLTALQPAKHF